MWSETKHSAFHVLNCSQYMWLLKSCLHSIKPENWARLWSHVFSWPAALLCIYTKVPSTQKAPCYRERGKGTSQTALRQESTGLCSMERPALRLLKQCQGSQPAHPPARTVQAWMKHSSEFCSVARSLVLSLFSSSLSASISQLVRPMPWNPLTLVCCSHSTSQKEGLAKLYHAS